MKNNNRLIFMILRKIFKGDGWTFLFLGAIGVFILGLLFFTVHNRNDEELTANVPPRYLQLFSFWHDNGYIKHGGLWIWTDEKNWTPPKNAENVKYAYRSSNEAHLFVPYVMEEMYRLAFGQYSVRLMCLYNQILTLASSVLLGLLAFNLAAMIKLKRRFCLSVAVIVLAVHQTFPVNLNYYWEIYYTTVAPIFAILIFICFCRLSRLSCSCRFWLWLKAAAFFLLSITDLATAVIFIPFYLLFCFIFVRGQERYVIKTVILPLLLAIAVIGLQLLIVRFNYPDIKFVGSGILFRTGFDGSVKYYSNHWDILFGVRRHFDFLIYPVLLLSGVVTFLLVLWRSRFEPNLHLPLLICYFSIGLFVPFAFVFSQGVTIHPYAYDSYLVISVLLLVFCVFPAAMEKFFRQRGYIVALFLLLGFCFCMVFLRDYARSMPLNPKLQDSRHGYVLQPK